MNQVKVKLPKDVAKALETVISNPFHSRREEVVRIHARDSKIWSEDCIPLNGIPLDTIIHALYIGYEVEETPEEKVREYYMKQTRHGNLIDSPDYVIRHVLDLLNIQIEGVNKWSLNYSANVLAVPETLTVEDSIISSSDQSGFNLDGFMIMATGFYIYILVKSIGVLVDNQ